MFQDIENPVAAIDTTIERRSIGDRRKNRLNIRWYSSDRRRRHVRRQKDLRRLFLLDYYSPKLFYWVVLILVLSLVDATLTLWLIELGATELNPLLDRFLKLGPLTFIVSKHLITSLSLVIVVILNYLCIQQLRFSMHRLLYIFAGLFGVVVLWQMALLKAYAF